MLPNYLLSYLITCIWVFLFFVLVSAFFFSWKTIISLAKTNNSILIFWCWVNYLLLLMSLGFLSSQCLVIKWWWATLCSFSILKLFTAFCILGYYLPLVWWIAFMVWNDFFNSYFTRWEWLIFFFTKELLSTQWYNLCFFSSRERM